MGLNTVAGVSMEGVADAQWCQDQGQSYHKHTGTIPDRVTGVRKLFQPLFPGFTGLRGWGWDAVGTGGKNSTRGRAETSSQMRRSRRSTYLAPDKSSFPRICSKGN